MDRQQQVGGHHIVHNGVEIIAGQIVPAPSVRPGRSAADEAAEGKAGHNKGLRQFSRQVRRRRPLRPPPGPPAGAAVAATAAQVPRPRRKPSLPPASALAALPGSERSRTTYRPPPPLRCLPLRAPVPPVPPVPQVWMKVMEKQKTNYNEVADELVQEFREEAAQVRVAQGLPPTPGPGELVDESRRDNPNLDERNVRRRVYDALNVLIALGIIIKHKKEIIWKGL